MLLFIVIIASSTRKDLDITKLLYIVILSSNIVLTIIVIK